MQGVEAAPASFWSRIGISRRRCFELLERGRDDDRASRAVDLLLVGTILISIVAAALESVQQIRLEWQQWLFWIEVVAVSIFTIEYVARISCAVEHPDPRFRGPVRGRLRYALTPISLADLLAILPFFISAFVAVDLSLLRILRLLRILKLSHYFPAFSVLVEVIHIERHALGATYFLCAVGIVLASAGIYVFEHDAQPEVFSSVPAAIYWSIVTLSTVGYGDVVPLTSGGRVMSTTVIMLGVGLLTVPSTIIATGFILEIRERREEREDAARGICPTCGAERRPGRRAR